MALKGSVVLYDFKLDLPLRKQRAALRAAGNKLATRVRKRLRASGKFQKSGQMVRSIKFRLRRGVASGVIAPFGIREDSDTHVSRKPMSNFSIAAFHAARGHNLIELTSADEAFLSEQISQQLAKAWGRK